jgi:hypothetical protein
MDSRFECVLDPCNRYVIWDNKLILPVLHHGRILSFSTPRRAQKVAALLNDAVGSDYWAQSSARREPTCRHGDGGANHAQHAIWQHDPDGTAGSPAARSLLGQQLVRRYRSDRDDILTSNIVPFPSRGHA